MADIDRNYVLELLADETDVQQDRVTLYTKKHHPARREIAGSRAYTLALLMHAVECGLLEQLAEEDAREGQPTIHDVMTAEELAEDDRQAEAYIDAMSEAGWAAGEGAPF